MIPEISNKKQNILENGKIVWLSVIFTANENYGY